MPLDNDLLILRYKHKIDWLGSLVFFAIANIVPLILIFVNRLLDNELSKLSNFLAIFIFVLFNIMNLYSTIREYKGWSEFRYDESRQFLIYLESKKKDISVPLDALQAFELRFIYDPSMDYWQFSAILDSNEKIKIRAGRKLPNKIAPLIADKMELELVIVTKSKILPKELRSRSDTIKRPIDED